jgi:hypothetical protein
VSEQLARVDAATVAAVARQALGRPAVQVVRWEHRVAYGGLGVVRGTNSLLRVSGEATDGGRPAPWSAYLKLTRVPPADASQAHAATHNDYWRREIATYESALPAQLPGGLTTPRCYGVVDAGDCVHLWLEDVQEDGVPWSLERYGLAGRHLGRFNGQYLAGRPRPAYPWLTRGFLRARADRNAPFWARLDALRGGPLFGAMFPGDAADRSRRLFADRHALLDALDRLPQTLVHQDADRRNLFGRAGAPGGARRSPSIGPTPAWGRWGPRRPRSPSPASCGRRAWARRTCPLWRRTSSRGTSPASGTPAGAATPGSRASGTRPPWPCGTDRSWGSCPSSRPTSSSRRR